MSCYIRIQNNCRTNKGPYIVLESKNQRFQGQGKGYQRKERRGKKETREGKGKEVRRERERKGEKRRGKGKGRDGKKRERKGTKENQPHILFLNPFPFPPRTRDGESNKGKE